MSRDIRNIFEIYLGDFAQFRKIKYMTDPDHIVDEDDVYESLDITEKRVKSMNVDISLSDDERAELIKKIKSTYTIFQPEGSAILGDYEHNSKWYENFINGSEYDPYYWNRYKAYLMDNHKLPEKVLGTLDTDTTFNIMSYIGDPRETDTEFSVRGLVVGDVQSGKTSNFIGLMAKAADAGYRVIFVLTGTIESLRAQTQTRIEEGFVGFDSANGNDVGVGRGDRLPITLTSRSSDFTGSADQTTATKIPEEGEPLVFVIKKNVSVLKKVYSSLKKVNTRSANEKINRSMLVIDDEADNASVNTNDEDRDPTKINDQIRKLLSLFTRSTYIGFTATPFANVFISYDSQDEMLRDDLFPRDFIYALHAPSNYCGSRKYFFESNPNVRFITDDYQTVFSMKHKKDAVINRLYDSVYHSVNTFLLANAIRDTYDSDINTHRSMLINMSRFTDVQLRIVEIINDYIQTIKKNVKLCCRLRPSVMMENPVMASLKDSFDREYSDIYQNSQHVEWEQITGNLYDAIKNIEVVAVNSSKKSKKLDYEGNKKTGLRVIAVGGLALSRGLTLEGLCVSYFYRNTATFDVLMQMGRWFGYRDDYAELCRIFITEQSRKYYQTICKSIEKLKSDIDEMSKLHMKPSEYGIRVMNDSEELGITARNKMRGTEVVNVRKNFYGNFFETAYLYNNFLINDRNVDAVDNLLNNINVTRDPGEKYPYYRDIDKSKIITLLKDIVAHPANSSFDTKQILKFLSRDDKELDRFDVMMLGGDAEQEYSNEHLGISLHVMNRQFDIRYNDEVVRMSAKRAHLIGPEDSAHGLEKDMIAEIKADNPGHKTQDFLIESRNPLLGIYLVSPRNSEAKLMSVDDINKCREFVSSLNEQKHKYLVGFCLFFPKKDVYIGDIETYVVPKTTNYFDRIHEEDNEIDGVEDYE